MVVTPRPELNAPDFEAMRHAMVVSQLRTSAVNDARVLAAMTAVPREKFVPEAARAQAYRDTGVAVGGGRALNPPIATGRLLTELAIRQDERVLVVGTAGGYTAAVVSMLGESVVAVESDPTLAADAKAALAAYPTVTLVEGPLGQGAAASGPFDVILVDGAVAQVPDALIAQLKPGGRLATGLVDRGVTRLAIGGRSEGGVGLPDFADVECTVLPGFEKAAAFSF